jgi:hypothetical protein
VQDGCGVDVTAVAQCHSGTKWQVGSVGQGTNRGGTVPRDAREKRERPMPLTGGTKWHVGPIW